MYADKLIGGVPDSQQVATAVNGAATVTLAAPGDRLQWVILACTISMSGDPAATAAFTIDTDTTGANTRIERLDFPAAACAPYNSKGVYVGAPGKNVVASLAALGTGIRGTVSVRAMKVPVGSI